MSSDHSNGRRRSVPDSGTPDAGTTSGLYDDFVLGGEAAVPPREFGPPITSNLPTERTVGGTVRELERRWRRRLSPHIPWEPRQPIPLRALWRRYREFALTGRSDVVDAFGFDPAYRDQMSPLIALAYDRYFRVSASGLENVPSDGPAILVANHSGPVPYDVTMLIEAVSRAPGRRLRPLVEDDLFFAAHIGAFLSRIGAVRACQDNALRLLDGGALIAVFPEGKKGTGKRFKNRYQLQRFGRGGYIKLAQKTGAPILPVAIVGAEETHPVLARLGKFTRPLGLPSLPITPTFPWLGPLGMLPLPSKWAIRIGEPIDVASQTSDIGDADQPESRVVISDQSSRVRAAVEVLLRDLLAERGGPFL